MNRLTVFILYIFSLQELFGEVPRREQHLSHMSDCHSPEPSTAVHRVRVYRSRQTRLSQYKPQSRPVGVHQGTSVNSVVFDCWVLCACVCYLRVIQPHGYLKAACLPPALCRRLNYWCPGWSVPLQRTHPRENIWRCDLKVLRSSGTDSYTIGSRITTNPDCESR